MRAAAGVLLGGVLLGASAVPACDVPVFRYALERWPADAYEAVVYRQGPLGAEEAAVIEALEQQAQGRLNLRVRRVDAEAAPGGGPLPWAVLRFPESAGIDRPVWAGRLADLPVARLADSPARREAARRILAGESAVWIFLESGDAAADGAAAALLESKLREAERTLRLPGSEEEIAAASPPLRLAFSVLRVSRGDPAEEMLVRTLLGSEEGLESAAGPMAFPVFGRGRKLEALAGKGISEDNIREYCAFLVGPCSCQMKLQNPGIDLLLSADWTAPFGDREVEAPPPPPAPASEPPPPSRASLLPWIAMAVAGLGAVIAGFFVLGRARPARGIYP